MIFGDQAVIFGPGETTEGPAAVESARQHQTFAAGSRRHTQTIGSMYAMTKLSRTTRRLGLAALATVPMLGALALSSTSAVASSATAKKSSTSTVTVSQSVSASTQAQTLAYWTQARRDAAKSANVVAGAQPPSSQPAGGPDGSPRSACRVLARPVCRPYPVCPSTWVATAAQPTEEPVMAAQPWSYPFPYDAFTVPHLVLQNVSVQGERHDLLHQRRRRLQMLRHVGGQWAQHRRGRHRGTLRGQHRESQ